MLAKFSQVTCLLSLHKRKPKKVNYPSHPLLASFPPPHSSFPRRREYMFRRMNKQSCVYLLASKKNGTLYVGVTSDLVQRVWQHKNKQAPGFTEKYDVSLLVYYEQHQEMHSATTREKQIKKWQRQWKINLIEQHNPNWDVLWPNIF